MPQHDKDLILSAYRMAGLLVMSERSGGGGWALIWHDEETGRYPGAGHFQYQESAEKQVILAGYLAEAIASEDLVDAEAADLSQALESALATMKKEKGLSMPVQSAQRLLKMLCSRWFQVRGYVRYVLKQWEDPAQLRRFCLSENPDAAASKERPAHHRAAYKPGAITPAAIIQGADPRYNIPDVMRAKEQPAPAPAAKPKAGPRVYRAKIKPLAKEKGQR